MVCPAYHVDILSFLNFLVFGRFACPIRNVASASVRRLGSIEIENRIDMVKLGGQLRIAHRGEEITYDWAKADPSTVE